MVQKDLEQRTQAIREALREDQPVSILGHTVAVLSRSRFTLQQHGTAWRALVIAHREVTNLDAMRDAERERFEQDIAQAVDALRRVHAVDDATPRLTGDDALLPRLCAIVDDVQVRVDVQTLVGDLREAMGMIRERVYDPLLKTFLDDQGRITDWPNLKRHKRDAQEAVIAYLASKFERDRRYREREVNEVLQTWHTFGDWAMLRRELFEAGYLDREKDGSFYWVDSAHWVRYRNE